MDLPLAELLIIAFLGTLLIYLTRFVVKGKTAMASRLWFVSFCTFVVFYGLAWGKFIVTGIQPFYYALLWPIPAILTFWLIETITRQTGERPAYRWMVYFLVGVVFALLLDTVAGYVGWYAYNNSTVLAPTFANPIGGIEEPAILLFMLGLLMTGVFFLTDTVFELLKKKYSASLTTYILIGLGLFLGGLVWVATEGIVTLANSLH